MNLIVLATLGVIHEALAAFDYRRVLNNLQSSNQQLSVANEQIRAEAATTEAFLVRLAHDLGSPIQGLLSIVSSDTPWRDDQRRLQALAAKQVALLRTFVEQARTYLQARTVSLRKSSVALLPLCTTAMDAADLLAQPRGVQIVPDFSVDSLTVWGNEAALRRILDNLLTNAVRISPAGEEVVLSVSVPAPGQVEIAVQDHGPGILPERQMYLFKPYTALQRLDGQEFPSPTGTGLGLGLAIVKELTTALGGTCGVTSTPGAGATFYVRLPASPASVSTADRVLHAKDTRRG